MVNISTKAGLLSALREKNGDRISGGFLAGELGVSRVAVWKGVQSLIGAGYSVDASDAGYSLDPSKDGDFLYPWEFGPDEADFRYYEDTGSTMDRAREFVVRESRTVVVAGKQSAGRGRSGRTWASGQGGLFCTVVDSFVKPEMVLADYCLPVMAFQIAIARVVSSLCGKQAKLRWPNDVYIDGRKIAGVMTELEGEGDFINWLAVGIGVNVNNSASLPRAVSCRDIAGHKFSRRDVLLQIMDEAETIKKQTGSGTDYSQGNRLLAAEWNSMADCFGGKAAVVASAEIKDRVLARGIFNGVDPAGRCVIKPEDGKGSMFFNPGPVSIVFLSEQR
jgi:BirA family biotin operon repressor/biotin-[acetyl-CoA-carboxylase] ligase